MAQTQENPFIDPRFKSAWDKGYAAGSAACIQKDEEIARLRGALEGLITDVKKGRDWTRHETALLAATEALK